MSVSRSFTIDTRQIMDLSRTLQDGPAIVQREMLWGMEGSVTELYGAVRDLTPRGQTGKLQASLQREITQSGKSITGTVKSLGSIAPHNRWVHDGRGPVVAKRAKALRITLPGGAVIFRKRVGPAKANPFMQKGLDRARPGLLRRFDDVTERIVYQLVRS